MRVGTAVHDRGNPWVRASAASRGPQRRGSDTLHRYLGHAGLAALVLTGTLFGETGLPGEAAPGAVPVQAQGAAAGPAAPPQTSASTPSTPAGPLSEAEVRAMVRRLFPERAEDRFLRILRCENTTLDPVSVHRNKDGSVDVGMAQINSIDRKRVEALFGEPFEVAMRDPWKNLQYAAAQYAERGEQPWACSPR